MSGSGLSFHMKQHTGGRLLAVTLPVFLMAAAIYAIALPLPPRPIVWYDFDPVVIPADRRAPVLFRARLDANALCPPACGGKEWQLVLQTSPPTILHDDGMNGDEKAADSVFSALLPVAVLTANLQPDDVYRPFVGYLDAFREGQRLARVNVFAEVADGSLPDFPVTSLAPDVQYTPYLVNIVNPDFLREVGNKEVFDDRELQRIGRPFYSFFPDSYQFLNFVYARNYVRNRHHTVLRNHVNGIGLSLFDNAKPYGSPATLVGMNVFPIPAFFDGAESGFVHETGHQWVNYLKFSPLSDVGGGHWPPSTAAQSLMGVSLPAVQNEGVAFPCDLVPEGDSVRLVRARARSRGEFSDLDLYLMGVLPPESVGEQIVLIDPPADLFSQCDGRVYRGKIRKVKIEDVIRVAGPRIPDHTPTSHVLKVASIVISPAPLDRVAMSYFSHFSRRAELTTPVPAHLGFGKGVTKPMAVATRGLLSFDTSIRPKAEKSN